MLKDNLLGKEKGDSRIRRGCWLLLLLLLLLSLSSSSSSSSSYLSPLCRVKKVNQYHYSPGQALIVPEG